MLFTDKPIEKIEEDLLGRRTIAKKLAEGIKNYKDEDRASLVIGIQGKWGDGKTSFINMVLEKNCENNQRVLNPDEFLIIEFNPWYFTGEDQILKQFCGLISEKICSIPDATDALKDAAKLIKRVSAIVKPIRPVLDIGGTFLGLPLAGTVANKILDGAGTFANDLEQAFQPTEDVVQIKEKISEELRKIDRKILVVIDDIDRLSHKEIYEVFRLIKIIGDFPNTIYLLSYDKEKVQAALAGCGHDLNFIDKIVQQEFDLPAIDEQSFSTFFDEGVTSVIKQHGLSISNDDIQHYGRLVYAGLKDKIQNFREAKRILNSLNFDYGCIKNEVYIVDLLALIVLKIHAKSAYEFLKNNGYSDLLPKFSPDLSRVLHSL